MFIFKKLRENYEREILKFKNPYILFKEKDSLDKSELISEILKNKGAVASDPFILVFKENKNFDIYDCGKYYIFKDKAIVSSEDEFRILLDFAEKKDGDLVYCDTEYLYENEVLEAHFKPKFSPHFLEEFDYIKDLFCVKKEFVRDGLAVKKTEDISQLITNKEKIINCEKVLCHYYCEEENTKEKLYESIVKKRVEKNYFEDEALRKILDNSVSVIMPSKDNPDLLSMCFMGLSEALKKYPLKSFELVLVDNGSSDENKVLIEKIIDEYNSLNITYIYNKEEFNFSKMCNDGASASKGDYLLFLNDDIEITDKGFLVKLLFYAIDDKVGAVGSKLLYPGGERIQHSGITNLKKCGPSHKLCTKEDNYQYFGYNIFTRNVSAVTGACLLINRLKYFKNKGFYDKMKVGYNDVDLCLSLLDEGYLNVLVNDSVNIHHESVTRGTDTVSKEKNERLKGERKALYERHPYLSDNDPYYNSNLTDYSIDYTVNICPEAYKADYRSTEVKGFKQTMLKKLINRTYGKCGMNIESTVVVRGIFAEGDCLEVKGWGAFHKKDNALFDRYLVISDEENNDIKVYTTASCYREDVGNVFPDSKNALLAGLVSRIPLEFENKKITFGILFVSKITGKKYYAGIRK